MARKNRTFNQLLLGLVAVCTLVLLIFMFISPKSGFANTANESDTIFLERLSPEPELRQPAASLPTIDQLTEQNVVVNYLITYKKLPDYYIKKGKARKYGWDAFAGNLCEALPGRAIGGDRFGNWEAKLPNEPGRVWYEADINYNCGRRGADRLVYSNDGLIYVTNDHYKNFRRLD